MTTEKQEIVQVRVSPRQKRNYEAMAAKSKISLSDWVRTQLDAGVDIIEQIRIRREDLSPAQQWYLDHRNDEVDLEKLKVHPKNRRNFSSDELVNALVDEAARIRDKEALDDEALDSEGMNI